MQRKSGGSCNDFVASRAAASGARVRSSWPSCWSAQDPKLTERQKREAIRRRDHDGEPVHEIARNYNVSQSTISQLEA
jgi:DNA-binding NarL/FixJ family response regulator